MGTEKKPAASEAIEDNREVHLPDHPDEQDQPTPTPRPKPARGRKRVIAKTWEKGTFSSAISRVLGQNKNRGDSQKENGNSES